MRIVKANPPNFEQIAAVFPHVKTAEGVLYCYGDAIYNPSGAYVPPQLIAHEQVHSAQQGAAVEMWWEEYLTLPTRRFEYELTAHQAEYAAFKKLVKNREERRTYLHAIAKRLSGPLYNEMISLEDAKREILGA